MCKPHGKSHKERHAGYYSNDCRDACCPYPAYRHTIKYKYTREDIDKESIRIVPSGIFENMVFNKEKGNECNKQDQSREPVCPGKSGQDPAADRKSQEMIPVHFRLILNFFSIAGRLIRYIPASIKNTEISIDDVRRSLSDRPHTVATTGIK